MAFVEKDASISSRFPRTKKKFLFTAFLNLKNGKPAILTIKTGKSSTTKVCHKPCVVMPDKPSKSSFIEQYTWNIC